MNIVIINRRFYGWNWNSPCTNYRAVIDHQQHQIFYIVDEKSIHGIHPLEKEAATVNKLVSLNDVEAVKQAVRQIHLSAPVDLIIALNEEDLLVAAQLRDELNIPGDRQKDVERFRNKIVMKQILKQKEIPVPEFAPAERVEDIVQRYGFPVVLKPVDGASSRGVKISTNRSQLERDLAEIGKQLSGYEAEQYIDGNIYHLDGLMYQGKLAFCQVYQYYNSCYAFANGIPVGVMMVDSTERQQKLMQFAERALNALDLLKGPFHLELFIDPMGEVRFLEVGARVGGAFVAPCIEKRWGINLFEENLRLQLSGYLDTERLRQLTPGNMLYGWLLFPVPDQPEAVVKKINCPDLKLISAVTDVILPEVGRRIDQTGGYILTAGTFLLKASSQDEQKLAIENIISQYKVEFAGS